MNKNQTKLVTVICHLMKEKIKETSIWELYEELDIFNVYVSGLCCCSLERNLSLYYKPSSLFYQNVSDIIVQLSEEDLETIDELHFELYEDIFDKHRDDVDKRILHYLMTGENDSLPEGFKKSTDYSFDTSKDLVQEYFEKYGKHFSSIEEVFNYCEEQDIDTYDSLYNQDCFNPSKHYILSSINEISQNGIECYLGEMRDTKLDCILA